MELVLPIFVVLVLPVLVALAFAIRRRWDWLAATTTVAAVPLQLLGLTSTCTQGADGSFFAGVILSAPHLVIGICATCWSIYKGFASRASLLVVLLVPVAMLIMTHWAWLNILQYGTPCGADYASSHAISAAIILAGYLLLPAILAACGAWALAKGKRGQLIP